MNQPRTLALVAALLGSALLAPRTPPAAPPLPGPGGVAAAVLKYLERVDAGDRPAVSLVDRAHAADFVVKVGGGLEQVDARTVPSFCDVDAAGRAFAAPTVAAFGKQLAAGNKRCAVEGMTVRSVVRAIRANCESADCSLATVEFERVYSKHGVEVRRVPLRATALLQWERVEGADFRIYHWHCAAADGARQMAARPR